MGKTVYSLVLSEDVVAAVDREAARQGLSRSALVNRVLAASVQLPTHQARRDNILGETGRCAGGRGLRPSVTPGGTLRLHTALHYKYNPTLCYTVELYEAEDVLGELRVGLRSQSQALLEAVDAFFEQWNLLETAYLPSANAWAWSRSDPRRLSRALHRPDAEAADIETGRAIAGYIEFLDEGMRTWFANMGRGNYGRAQRTLEEFFLDAFPGLGLAGAL